MLNLTDAEIESRWDAGNDAGRGFAVGAPDMSPLEAAQAEGYTDVRTFDTRNSTSHCVVARDGEQWIAICDANGPWAVCFEAPADDDFPDTCEACGHIMGLCICRPVLHQVADALTDKGYSASYEYPGYVSVKLGDRRIAAFGDADGDYRANWEEDGEPIDFFLPASATVPELIAAIEAWVTKQVGDSRW